MSTFWLGAGAAATVILAVIAVLQFARSRSHLLVEVRQYRFEFPVTLRRALTDLETLTSPLRLLANGKDPEAVDDEALAACLKSLVPFSSRSLHDLGRIDAFCTLKLTNRGHERVEGVELHVPDAVQIEVRRADARQLAEKDRAVVGELRPGETVDVVAWGRRAFEE